MIKRLTKITIVLSLTECTTEFIKCFKKITILRKTKFESISFQIKLRGSLSKHFKTSIINNNLTKRFNINMLYYISSLNIYNLYQTVHFFSIKVCRSYLKNFLIVYKTGPIPTWLRLFHSTCNTSCMFSSQKFELNLPIN